ncbi:MAG: PHP domain-containing protein [Arcanobacterium sp.]|nr:PHP domain-containing protein [Arcanobacterium sp.]
MKIDLHTHSSASDGTDAPEQLPQLAHVAGLDVVALTDHDTVAGWELAARAAPAAGVALVRGIEITTHCLVDPAEHPAGKNQVSVHILGYLFDPSHPLIASHIARMASARDDRAREIVARLAVDYPINWETVQNFRDPAAPIGRPHIADALVAAGIVADRSAAFRTILSTNSPYYVPNHSPLAADAVQWIVQAGGKAVLAHPKARARGNYLPDAAFGPLRDAGLFGVEVNHRDNPPAERAALARLAAALGLREFGSSDYHGTGKPNRLGENVTHPEVYEELLAGTFMCLVE